MHTNFLLTLVIGSEPAIANDAYLSRKQGSIYRFKDSPNTVADGLRTLGVSERAFNYLQKLDDFFLADEHLIYYWTTLLTHLLKIACEPSCALNMVGVVNWLKRQSSKKILAILMPIPSQKKNKPQEIISNLVEFRKGKTSGISY